MMRLSLRWLLLPALLFVVHPLHAMAGGEKLPTDLALVPGDGMAFAHVRLGDIWQSEYLSDWRKTIKMAGAKSLSAFNSRFFPAPSSLERITLVMAEGTLEPVVIIATSKTIDRASFLKYTLPGAKAKENDKSGLHYVYEKKNLAIFFADDRTLVVGPSRAVEQLLSRPKAAGGNLNEAIKLAASGKAAVLAVNVEPVSALIRLFAFKDVPPPMQAVLDPMLKATLATLSLDLRGEGQIDLRLSFADAKQTTDAELAIKQGIKLARGFIDTGRQELNTKIRGKTGTFDDLPESAAALFGLGMLNQFDEYLASGPVKNDGNSLLASAKIPHGGQIPLVAQAAAVGLLVSAVQKIGLGATRAQSMNNLKQISLAMHEYHNAHKMLPAAAICDKAGKPLLSWRVAILPFIEQLPLYEQFKLDEPWDSDHNKKLIAQMPSTYVVPAAPAAPGQTHYRVFVGNGAVFEMNRGRRMAEISDGLSNTILCVEARQSVPWTKPDELVFNPKEKLPQPPNFYGNGVFNVAFCDASAQTLSSFIDDVSMRAYITCAGNEVIKR
jgi:Protein of unknown function (DUF1559)